MHNALFGRRYTSVGTAEHACKATDALVAVYYNYSVLSLREGAGDTVFHAQRIVTVAAIYREVYIIRAFHQNVRINLFAHQRLCHVCFSCLGKSAVVLAEMAPEAPFFIHINTFHDSPLFASVLDTEHFKFFFIKPYAAKHETVSAKRLDRVDTHASHKLLNFMIPRADKIAQSLITDFGIETFYQLGALRRYTPVALTGLT